MQEGKRKTRRELGCIIFILVVVAVFTISVFLMVNVFSKSMENYLDNKIKEQQEITTEFDKNQN